MSLEDDLRQIAKDEVDKKEINIDFPDVQRVTVENWPEKEEKVEKVEVTNWPQQKDPVFNVPPAQVNVETKEVVVEQADLSQLAELMEKHEELLNRIAEKPEFDYEKYDALLSKNAPKFTGHGGVSSKRFIQNTSGQTINPATKDAQTDGTQKTQIVDSSGDAVNVTHDGFLRTRASEDSMFNDLVTVERTNLIELKSNVNVVSALRDITTETDGTVTATGGEYVVASDATASANVILESAEIGRYKPGYAAECGIAVRSPDTLTGEQEQRWGYYDADDGFYFGKDATGTFIAYKRAGGAVTKVYQENWNVDTMDGSDTASNPSGQTLTVTNGNIYQIRFAWYGYGPAEWIVVSTDVDTGEQILIVVHRYKPTTTNSIANPNLPIRAEVLNGATATGHTLYVAGRQFSILGTYNPNRRVTSEYRLSQGSVDTTFLPTVSFRRKDSDSAKATSVKIESLDAITDADLLVQIRVDATLTSPTYGTPRNHTAQETAVEADYQASAVSGGEIIYETLIASAGQGSNAKGSASRPLLEFDLPRRKPVTVCVRRVSGTGATVSTVLRVTEEW